MIRVTGTNLEDFLGKPKYRPEKKNKKNEVGIVRGLAWTSVGGVTLEIEVNLMPGKGSVVLTGKLGDVMKESAQTGISYIRSISEDYHIDPEFFQKHDIHIHVPEGAVPKDGPSAGITMANRNSFCGHREAGTGRCCHDRGNYTARTCTSDWRIKREIACGKECRNEDGLYSKRE